MLRALIFAAFLSLWAGFVAAAGKITLDGGKYRVWWDRKADEIHFGVEVRAVGWVSFGFALQAPTGMRGYDVMVGGVQSGRGYIGVSECVIRFNSI